MKALVLVSVGHVRCEERDIPTCGPEEVLVRVKSCGICRTDWKCSTLGHRDLILPRVLGHEVAGIIVETGERVTDFRAGDRVQVSPGLACGSCHFCQAGRDHLCGGMKIMGFHYDGGFQEYLLLGAQAVRNQVLNLIPENLSWEEACMAEPLACTINMQDSMQLGKIDSLLIHGTGRLGLLNLKLARYKGVKTVIGVEGHEGRLRAAEAFGFDHLIDASKARVIDEVRAITRGRGVEAAIPCCSAPEAMAEALEATGKQGAIGFFSGISREVSRAVDFNQIHYKELRVYGAYGCRIAQNRKALHYMSSGRIEVRDLITKIIPLEEIPAGLDMVNRLGELSVVIRN